MESLLNLIGFLFPSVKDSHPVELIPAALMIAGFAGVALFGFAMSLYDSWKEQRS